MLMSKKMPAILFIAMILSCTVVIAQSSKLTVNNVYKTTLRNSGTIVEDQQVKGYFFLYMSDKIDRKTNEYTLQIIDENLNKVKDISFTDSKDLILLESSYNGSSIGFLFYNTKDNIMDFRLYKMDGKQSFTYSKTLDKKTEKYFAAQIKANQESDEIQNTNIFNVPDKGFLSVMPIRDSKKYTYEINFYSSDKRRSWTYNPVEIGKYANAAFLGANDSIAVFEVVSKNKLTSKDMETTLLGINLHNGKKAFDVNTHDGKHQLLPMNLTPLRGMNEFIVVGPYFFTGDNIAKDNSEGLGIWLMNSKGKVVKSKYMSWTKDMSKFLNVDHKGRVADLGYVFIHKIVQTDDGKIFAIAEGYKKVADGLGIALTVLSRSHAGTTKLKITDLLMLEFTKDFNLKNVKVYEKNNNNLSLGDYSYVNQHSLALMAKQYGYFDYSFTQLGKNNESFSMAYTDYERSKGYKGMTFHSISYFEGKLTNDKMEMDSDATSMAILPAKPGFVMIMEYFRKAKKIDIRLEKLN